MRYPEGMQLNKLNIIKHKYNSIKLIRMRLKQIWAEFSQDGYMCKAVASMKTVLWTMCTEGMDYFCLAVKFNYYGNKCYSFVLTVIKYILQQYIPYLSQCYSAILSTLRICLCSYIHITSK